MRAIVEPNKVRLRGTAARAPFDVTMEHVAVPAGVIFESGTVGGLPGWCILRAIVTGPLAGPLTLMLNASGNCVPLNTIEETRL